MDCNLERLAGERLARLPAPQAPVTLRPRVMAAVDARRRRPAMRPWFAWPLASQTAFVAALAVAVGGAVVWLPGAAVRMGWTPSWVTAAAARTTGAAHDVQAASEAVRIFAGAFLSQPLVLCLVALILVMTAACAMFGALLGRMANVGVQGAD